MTIIGAYARIDRTRADATVERLDALEGVVTFPLQDRDRLGVLVEAEDVERARDILLQRVARTEGVLGTWPISVHEDGAFETEIDEGNVSKECQP